MNKRERIETVIIYGIFICYLILLIKILFLSRVSLLEMFNSQRTINRSVNLIPFYSIWGFLSGGPGIERFAFGNVVGNIVLFVPFGVYLPLLKKDKRTITSLLIIFAVSLFAETVQGLLGIGAADIDDIILNCLGGWIGIMAFKLLLRVLRDEKKTRTVITILSVALGLPVLFYFLFVIKMRF